MDGSQDDFDGIIQPSIYHRTIDGCLLFEARSAVGVSQEVFADACGHSQQFQQQIESPGMHEVLTSKSNTICNVLVDLLAKKHGVSRAMH